MKNFTREVRAPVDLVIEAVREETREWRESVIPPELRKLGVARMKGNVQPPFFRFWLAKPSGSDDTPMTLRAVVIATPDGGARLRGGIGRRLDSRFALVFPLVGLVALAWGAGGVVSAAIVSAIGMFAGLAALARRGALVTSDAPEADYLMQRLAHALAAAEEKAALAAATQPGALPPSRAARPKSPARIPWRRA